MPISRPEVIPAAIIINIQTSAGSVDDRRHGAIAVSSHAYQVCVDPCVIEDGPDHGETALVYGDVQGQHVVLIADVRVGAPLTQLNEHVDVGHLGGDE